MSATLHEIGAQDFRVEIAVASDVLSETFGPRFDRTAYVTRFRAAGHDLLHPFGLCDEFGITGTGVLGFTAAQPGETFLKIGVGRLRKEADLPYHFAEPYPLIEKFHVETVASSHRLSVQQTGQSPDGSHAYDYRKIYRASGRNLRIYYELANTGTTSLEFEHYNHHWFCFEKNAIDNNYEVSFGFPPPPSPSSEWLVRGTAIRRALAGPQTAPAWRFTPPSREPIVTRLAHAPLGLSVTIHPSFSPSRLALWSDGQAICPEIFLRRELAPGNQTRWGAIYRVISTSY